MDYDGDGDLDLVTSSDDCCDVDNEFFLFRRGDDGRFQARRSIRMRIAGRQFPLLRSKVFVSDWDRDGQVDLVLHERGLLLAPGPLADRPEIELTRTIEGSESIRVIFTKPYVIDWNRDGLPDLLVGMHGSEGGGVYLFRGLDHAEVARLAAPERLGVDPHGGEVTGLDVADWDGDGLSDLILGVTWHEGVAPRRSVARSQVWVYRRLPPD